MSDLNDPRVLFAAERTLLAWSRTSLALIAFGFVIERSGTLLLALQPQAPTLTYWLAMVVGIGFVGLGVLTAALSCRQYRRVLRSLRPVEIPSGYATNFAVVVNLVVALLATLLAAVLVISSV